MGAISEITNVAEERLVGYYLLLGERGVGGLGMEVDMFRNGGLAPVFIGQSCGYEGFGN